MNQFLSDPSIWIIVISISFREILYVRLLVQTIFFHWFTDISTACNFNLSYICVRGGSNGCSEAKKIIPIGVSTFVHLLLLRMWKPHSRATILHICTCRVDRVLSFSSVVGVRTPQPLARRRECPPIWFRGEGHTCWRERGWESPNSDEETYIVVLCKYMCFVYVLYLYGNRDVQLSHRYGYDSQFYYTPCLYIEYPFLSSPAGLSALCCIIFGSTNSHIWCKQTNI
jgi:hypothetical protein